MSSSRKGSMSASVGGSDKEKNSGATAAAASAGSGGGGGERSGTSTSKAYSSHLAVQTDATKYRGKYKELKRKVRQIEMENDKLHFKTLRIKRNIQRMRLERAILYERLEMEIGENAAMAESENNIRVRRTYLAPSERIAQEQIRPISQQSNSTPSGRRVIDYSPSPEDTIPASTVGIAAPILPPAPSPANTLQDVHPQSATGNGEARSGMKVTLKRHSHTTNGKEPSW